MPGASKTAIAVASHHPETSNWLDVIWGRPPHDLGRITTALSWLLAFDANRFFVGTSPRDINLADPMITALREGFGSLARFHAFAGTDLRQARAILDARSRIVAAARGNTYTEIDAFLRAAQTDGIEHVVLVSSPDHAPRCLRDAQVVQRNLGSRAPRVIAIPSDVAASGEPPAVLEAPHRPDRDQAPLNRVGDRLTRLPGDRRCAATRDIERLLDHYTRHFEMS